MLSSILSDTLYLTSPTTTQLDKDAVVYLSEIAGVDDLQSFFDGMLNA